MSQYGYPIRKDPPGRLIPAGEQPSRVTQPRRSETRHVTLAARQATKSPSTIPAVKRTVAGLVFRDLFDRADGAPGANWTAIAGGANWTIAANRMKNASTADAERIITADAAMAELATMIVQAKPFRVGANRNTFPGVRAKWSAAGANENCYGAVWTNNGGFDVIVLQKVVGGVATTLATSADYAPPGFNGTIFKLSAKAGEQKLWCIGGNDGNLVFLLTAADAALDALLGRAGLSAGWFQVTADYHEFDDFAVYRGNTVKCTGLPSGYKLNVVDPWLDTPDITAVEAGGVAVADLDRRACPLTRVEILTAGNVVLHSFTPTDGVWGGDEYEVRW